MTSNGDSVLNASSTTTAHNDTSSHSSRQNPTDKRAQDGQHDDSQAESEAETEILSHTADDDDKSTSATKHIKTERSDDEDSISMRQIRTQSATHSPVTNGRRRSSGGKVVKINGTKHGSERDAKSPIPTSPSSVTNSRHTKDTSPAGSVKSPPHSARSPTQTLTRGRSASTVDNRKRKLRDDSYPKSVEPPRQKAKTEGVKDTRHTQSPVTAGFGRPHKRSQSTQSVATGATGRKRRDGTGLAVHTDRHWTDSSSERSNSPPQTAPNVLQHSRLKRGSGRALTSPARQSMGATGRKTDRFGATRLAREAEKGDLDGVKEAYEDAPDELDMVDYAGIAPLQKAALHGYEDVVEYLIKKGCRTNCESNDRDTPLIDAVENSHLEVVKLLLNEGHVNPHHANKKGQRAFDVLDQEGPDHDEIAKELREAMRRQPDTSSNDQEQPGRKHAKTASRLLYNEYNVETLIEKAGDGDISAVGELINSNIKPNIACGVAAARGGHYDILSILLASGLKADPDPSKHPETPMTVAIGRGHLSIIELLLEQDNFDPTRRNKEGKTYFEISESREGPKWEAERDLLKRAYDDHKGASKSPRRTKKEAPNAAARMKRKSSPRRERSVSPAHEPKRVALGKTSSNGSGPQKSRRLLSGKEKASREGHKRRVVDNGSDDDESEDDVRPPTRKAKLRSFSEGQDGKPERKTVKARLDENEYKRAMRRSHADESEENHEPRAKSLKPHHTKATLDVDSPDERKPLKNKIKYKTVMEDKIRKRKLSDASTDEISVKKTPTVSAKSTPAPPERTATPEVERARRQEELKAQAEAKRKAAEAEARKKEEEEAARKAAEEERLRKKAEAEAEAKREADRIEAERQQAEEEARRRAQEEEERRQKELAARRDRLSKLPLSLRNACERGNNRHLHFSGEELGITQLFLPLMYVNGEDLSDAVAGKTYIPSFQLVGILGLAELDLAHLEAPYSEWSRIPIPVSDTKSRGTIIRRFDTALLAQDIRFPSEGMPDFDFDNICAQIKVARKQFFDMEGLYWVEEDHLMAEVEKSEFLRPILEQLRKSRAYLPEFGDSKRGVPKMTFMDMFRAKSRANSASSTGDVNGANGVKETNSPKPAHSPKSIVNGNGTG